MCLLRFLSAQGKCVRPFLLSNARHFIRCFFSNFFEGVVIRFPIWPYHLRWRSSNFGPTSFQIKQQEWSLGEAHQTAAVGYWRRQFQSWTAPIDDAWNDRIYMCVVIPSLHSTETSAQLTKQTRNRNSSFMANHFWKPSFSWLSFEFLLIYTY